MVSPVDDNRLWEVCLRDMEQSAALKIKNCRDACNQACLKTWTDIKASCSWCTPTPLSVKSICIHAAMGVVCAVAIAVFMYDDDPNLI